MSVTRLPSIRLFTSGGANSAISMISQAVRVYGIRVPAMPVWDGLFSMQGQVITIPIVGGATFERALRNGPLQALRKSRWASPPRSLPPQLCTPLFLHPGGNKFTSCSGGHALPGRKWHHQRHAHQDGHFRSCQTGPAEPLAAPAAEGREAEAPAAAALPGALALSG